MRWVIVCLALVVSVGVANGELQRIRMKAKDAARLRSAGETEASLGSLESEGSGMLTQSDLDSARKGPAIDPANCSPQNSPCGSGCCTPLKCEPTSQVCLTAEAVKAIKQAQKEQKEAEKKQKAAERKQKAAEEKKRKAEAEAKKKAEREQKKKERQAKRKAERDRKKKERERKQKEREQKRKDRMNKKKKKHQKKDKNKVMLSCQRDPSHNGEMKCHEMEHDKHDTPEQKLRRRKVRKTREGKPQINFSDGDGGTWKTVAPNPWPPHNLNIKTFVLTGIGSTNIQCAKAIGGHGLPNPSPLILKFPIGYDTRIHKLVEKHKDREEVSGVLYYVAGNGKAVGKLTFENAVIASIKWPKLEHSGPKSDKPAMIQVILQPASSTVERIEKVRDAPSAPVPDTDKLHTVLGKNFKLDLEGVNNTDSIIRVTLPSIVMNMKRRTEFGWDPETKRQKRSVIYKVTGIKHKHLFIRVSPTDVKQYKEWKHEAQKRPRLGTVEIDQTPEISPDETGGGDGAGDMQPLYSIRFFGLYPNRIIKGKNHFDVELSFDKMSIEHHDPE